jgi:kumamolisin
MTRFWLSCLLALMFVAVAVSAQETGANIKAHPHFTGSHVENGALRLPPFETPPSLACIYRLVSQTVPGCPVRGTTAVPTGGSGIIAVINAFDYPTALQDLNVFSKRFGVQPCDSSNPCFQKVYATGVQPPTDGLWAANAAAVIEYAHAFAPSATVILVEGATDTIASLNRAVKVAHQIIATHGGKGQVILPFGSLEWGGETAVDPLFTAPGVVYLSGSPSGINGFIEYPAISPNVIAVGGTAVLRDPQGNMTDERAAGLWTGGTSRFETRPAYQDVIQEFVGANRGIPDVSFAADAFVTPMLMYDSTDSGGFVGWQYTGHLGFGEAVWASILSRNGNVANSTAEELAILYGDLENAGALRDITWGSVRGIRARTGWDFLTGVGVPVGLLGN